MTIWEEQQLLRRHHRPRDDREPVPGTSLADLDEAAVKAFANSVRRTTPTLASASDEEILIRLNAMTPSGEATVAGLYALGVYPQQFLPHLSLTAAVIDPKDLSSRGTNRIDFTGPLPTILDGAVDWVSRNVSRTMVVTRDGHAQDSFSIPLIAVREVVANALVHRDLSDAAAGRVVDLRLTPEGLVLTNPGGLWGLSIDQLGTPDGKSAVNEFLYGICRHVSGNKGRVIEAMGTGIPETRRALAEAGLEPPQFFDNSLRFTVRFPNHALHSSSELSWLGGLPLTDLNTRQKEALLYLRNNESIANSDYRKITGTDSTTARRELQDLMEKGLVIRTGERRGTRYRLAPDTDEMNPSGSSQ